MVDVRLTSSKLWVINFYKEQLSKFRKLGVGNETENEVLITESLIRLTEDRLNKLSVVYDRTLSPQAHKLRRSQLKRFKKGFHNN